MAERRENFRVEWQSPGIVVGADGVRHSCTVDNLSNGGARISGFDVDVANLAGALRLRLSGEKGPGRMCMIAWRKSREAGVEFLGPAAPVAPSRRSERSAA